LALPKTGLPFLPGAGYNEKAGAAKSAAAGKGKRRFKGRDHGKRREPLRCRLARRCIGAQDPERFEIKKERLARQGAAILE